MFPLSAFWWQIYQPLSFSRPPHSPWLMDVSSIMRCLSVSGGSEEVSFLDPVFPDPVTIHSLTWWSSLARFRAGISGGRCSLTGGWGRFWIIRRYRVYGLQRSLDTSGARTGSGAGGRPCLSPGLSRPCRDDQSDYTMGVVYFIITEALTLVLCYDGGATALGHRSVRVR